MDRIHVLQAISYTEPSTFGEFCGGLKTHKPTEKSGWRELFQIVNKLEKEGLIEVERSNGQIESLILTEDGANEVRRLESGEGRIINGIDLDRAF